MGATAGFALWGLFTGFVMLLLMYILLPAYVRLWNRKYTLRIWQYVIFGLTGIITIIGSGVWGATFGIERSGAQLVESIAQGFSDSSAWKQITREVASSNVPASSQIQLYVDGALEYIRSAQPHLANLLDASIGENVETHLSGIAGTTESVEHAIIDSITGHLHNTIASWILKIRVLVTAIAGGVNILFLSGLAWLALRDIRL